MECVKLKGNPVTLQKEFVKTGALAPDFVLVDQYLKDCSLKDLGKKRKLFSIVPSLDTEVCLASTKVFNQIAKQNKDLVVLLISADLPFAQKRVCGLEKIENMKTLSMIRSKDFARDYGVLIVDGPLAGLCARAVIVLDENNTIIYCQLVEEISQEPNYDKALAALKN
jgi:thiol peroxidase